VSSSRLIAAHESFFARLRLTSPALFADAGAPRAQISVNEPAQRDTQLRTNDDVLFAVSKLEEPARHIMLLQLVNAMSIDDIAHKLRVPRATVAVTLSVAHERVKRYFSMCG
jgi:DNA-directed RNA polymerase specialized sigma24 family protein